MQAPKPPEEPKPPEREQRYRTGKKMVAWGMRFFEKMDGSWERDLPPPPPPKPPEPKVIEFRVPTLPIYKVLKFVTVLADEPWLRSDGKSLHLHQVDLAHVAMATVDIPLMALGLRNRIPEFKIVLDGPKVLKALEIAKNMKVATVRFKLSIREPTENFKGDSFLSVIHGFVEHDIKLPDKEGVGDPKVPVLEYTGTTAQTRDDFLKVLESCRRITDNARITISHGTIVVAEGDDEKFTWGSPDGEATSRRIYQCKKHEPPHTGSCPFYTMKGGNSNVPLDYFVNVLRGMPPGRIQIDMGVDYPVRITSFVDGMTKRPFITLMAMIAPRIVTE